MITGQAIAEEAQVKDHEFLSHSFPVSIAILGKFEQKGTIMAPMIQMKDASFDSESIGSIHDDNPKALPLS